jgi:hypothetical protein
LLDDDEIQRAVRMERRMRGGHQSGKFKGFHFVNSKA